MPSHTTWGSRSAAGRVVNGWGSRGSLRALLRRPLRACLAVLGISLLLPALGLAAEPTPVAPGAFHWYSYRPEGPWAINVLEADLGQEVLELDSVLGGAATVGRRPVSSMLAGEAGGDRVPVAGVNGDFFAMTGGAYTTIPLGLQIASGELVTLPDPARSVFYVLGDGSGHIGRLRAKVWLYGPGDLLYPISAVNRPPERGELVLFTPRFGRETRSGDSLAHFALTGLSGRLGSSGEVSARVGRVDRGNRSEIPADGAVLVANGVAAYALRGLKAGDGIRVRVMMEPDVGEIRAGVSGGPRLVREGRVSVEHRRERFANGFAMRRHPRTGVGLRDGRVVLVTVDGRQPGYSDGMTLPEFAQLFLQLGCTEAMNLDGGGSSTMVVRDRVVNSPSDGAERRVANALALFSRALPTGEPVRLAVEPAEVSMLGGDTLALAARGLDEYYNPIRIDARRVRWDCGGLGRVDEQGNFTAGQVALPTAGLITARYEELQASVVMCVAPAPARLSLTPERTSLPLRGKQQFVLRAYDEDNRPIRLPAERVEWACEPSSAGGGVSASGLLVAPPRQARLRVIARVGETEAAAHVLVGAPTAVVVDFERAGEWGYAGVPEGTPGSVAVVPDPLDKGNHCLRLTYDLSAGEGTRGAYALLGIGLPDTRAISIRALGDGQGGWLRARLRDAADRLFTVDLADRVDWSREWRALTAWLPDEAVQPLTLESVYVTEYRAERRPAGQIHLDDIGSQDLQGSPSDKAAGPKEGDAMGELPTYVCRRTREPVRIDGVLDDEVWTRAAAVGEFMLTEGKGSPQLPTEVKLAWDDVNLYLAFVAVDTDIWGTMRKRDDPIYEEEAVEAFLSSGGDVTKYYEFEWSPHNVFFDAKIECPEEGDRSRLKVDLEWECKGHRSAVRVAGTLDKRDDVDQQWTVEAALPFSEIGRQGRPPIAGERWRANLYRIDRAGEGEFSCWSPTLKPDFHVPGRFGHLVFSAEPW